MSCEMCGVDNEIYAEVVYKNFKQKICKECFEEGIPRYTKILRRMI